MVMALGVGMAMGQAPVPRVAAAGAATTPAKPLAFDVVSIRQNVSQQRQMGMPQFGPTSDGYRMTNAPLILPIITAYVPSTGATSFTPEQIAGLPDWAMRDNFDIEAKVGDEDLPEWQKPDAQKAMLQGMLQALLVDRCKMTVHREIKEVPVYSLVLGKGAQKFRPTNPDETHEGMKLPFGGTVSQGKDGMTLYAASMESVATLLSGMGRMGSARPIQDKTGLTGLYDFVFPREMGPPPGPQDPTAASDPGGSFVSGLVETLGLKLESTKAPVETLVIDHIEKPSQN